MSRSTTHTFTCPCGKVFNYQQYEYVNVVEDPLLRYIVLAGLVNMATCPNCGRRAAFATPFIYSDPAYDLLAYVHPRPNVPDEARMLILEKLRTTYKDIVSTHVQQEEHVNGGRVVALSPSEAKDFPSLKVLFGLEQLTDVINGVLSPEERLGKLALHTQSRSEAARGQFLDIMRKFATEMGCFIEVEDLPDEYTVWLYGSRRQIGAIMRALAPRG
ncbi:MAG TPA: CpXC domain-containing protein [Ktedonobacteraceae bacterium]